ncbi:hypothetical protein PC129_g12668 [Phytophthora cactorum]|uniref:Uncharacterized protein n=1 Tax=Phytophthora cactorum TaxID=29920 RepID=A0A329RSV5_9STRA|nr:hypothetical protein GQ600_27283 [Phytophthora cactorum]KAG2821489.1 hypothetical protein PC112_g11345 [Phytophthora cactorum]KAG2828050.1 hypothetical protein PC111_g8327 [Phytophthora cactorum]KAG2856058.1 hypothetical protein PC113_g11908 [Phytophthora cactorum]KAG2893399.1 hypothetical protein PC114_g16285 [Phytophthora cactorum]
MARELLRSEAHELQELQDKIHMMAEALNDLVYAREELEAMLLREAEVINELTASVGETSRPSGYAPSYGVLVGQVIRILRRDPTGQ